MRRPSGRNLVRHFQWCDGPDPGLAELDPSSTVSNVDLSDLSLATGFFIRPTLNSSMPLELPTASAD